MTGTAAISRPLAELDSRRSAVDSSAHGAMISTTANATSHGQRTRSAASCETAGVGGAAGRPGAASGRGAVRAGRQSTAAGTSTSAPRVTRAQTSTGTETPASATLISRYGMPQMTLMTANSVHPRLLKPGSFARKSECQSSSERR
jgi:hypothetical protein